MFFEVRDITQDDGVTALLTVTWCRKMTNGWKPIATETIRISKRDYGEWMPYHPPEIGRASCRERV